MADFGKRASFGTRGAQQSPARRPVVSRAGSPAAVSYASGPASLISARDMRHIDKGHMPAWTRMSRLQLLGFALVLPLVMLAAIWSYAPDIVRDHRYAGTYAVAPDLRATNGECTRYAFLVTLCSAKVHEFGRNEQPIRTSFMMLLRSSDGARMVPVRSTVDPSAIGIRFAVTDMLWTRTLSLTGSVLVLLAMSWLFLSLLLRGRHMGSEAHAAALEYAAARMPAAPAAA